MRKFYVVAFCASMLVFTAASTALSQSAEDMAKGQKAGVRYTAHHVDEDTHQPRTEWITIRGDEVTRSNSDVGVLCRFRVTNKRTEGSQLILETTPPFSNTGPGTIIIEGDRLIFRADDRSGKRDFSTYEVYTRE